MHELLQKLMQRYSPAKLVDLISAKLGDLVTALVVALLFWIAWKVLGKALARTLARTNMDETAQTFVHTTTQYAFGVIAVITVAAELGVNTASLLGSLGVAGLTLGFAARDALSNVISGIFIFWDRPFVLGDLVEIDGKYGRVDRITMRSTRVVTVDGRMLAIPNTVVLNTVVASYTNFPNLRLDVGVTVGVEENLGRVRELLLELVADNEEFMQDPAPVVVVTELNDYNVAVELRAWLKDERQHVAKRMELREQVFETLRGAGVELPFETFKLEPVELHQAA